MAGCGIFCLSVGERTVHDKVGWHPWWFMLLSTGNVDGSVTRIIFSAALTTLPSAFLSEALLSYHRELLLVSQLSIGPLLKVVRVDGLRAALLSLHRQCRCCWAFGGGVYWPEEVVGYVDPQEFVLWDDLPSSVLDEERSMHHPLPP